MLSCLLGAGFDFFSVWQRSPEGFSYVVAGLQTRAFDSVSTRLIRNAACVIPLEIRTFLNSR